MELTYRRTIQVREYESITIEAKTTVANAHQELAELELFVDGEIEEHRDRLRKRASVAEFADDEDLS
jgi:hypothetical protein